MRLSEQVESVDVRLRELLEELIRYRLKLEIPLSERYKQFEREVLRTILYDKNYDRWEAGTFSLPTNEEKEQLLRAFDAAGLLDVATRKRIDRHFEVAQEAIGRLRQYSSGTQQSNETAEQARQILLEDILIVPLMRRTTAIVEAAQDLEKSRESFIMPIRNYERIVNSFLHGKILTVAETGELQMKSADSFSKLDPKILSSGEKQILILLTQALLEEERPVVYVADEPELSLHLKWQEKLLPSLIELGGQIQIIVATHSPDIVGPYLDKIIELDKIGN